MSILASIDTYALTFVLPAHIESRGISVNNPPEETICQNKWLRCSFSRANLGVVGNEMASEGGVPIGCQLSGTSARLVGPFGLVGWWAE